MSHHPCPECGASMVYETRNDTLEYKGQERIFPMLARWCTECEEAIFEGEPLAAREKAFLEFKAEVDCVLSPAEVTAVRTKLGLSQRKASEILGGGPRSFFKYESGRQAVSVPMSHLLRLLDKVPSRLEELGFKKMPKAPVSKAEGIVMSSKESIAPSEGFAFRKTAKASARKSSRPPAPRARTKAAS